jgi:hypothetical protein
MLNTMNLFARATLAALAVVIVTGCAAGERTWLGGEQALFTGTEAITAQASASSPAAATSGLLPSPLLGPERVSVFVGDDLVLDLDLINPGEHSLVAGQIPAGATFFTDSAGGTINWTPDVSEAGEHDLILYAVLTDSPEQVMGTASIDVSVLPRFGLIEYGF